MPTNHRPVLVSLAPASRFKTIKIIKICLTAAWVTKWCDQTTTSATAIRSRGDYKNPVSSILQHTYSNMTSLAYCCPYCAYCSIIIRIWYFNKYVLLECFTLVIFSIFLKYLKIIALLFTASDAMQIHSLSQARYIFHNHITIQWNKCKWHIFVPGTSLGH